MSWCSTRCATTLFKSSSRAWSHNDKVEITIPVSETLEFPLELQKTLLAIIPGPVAQRLEQGTHNPLVGGSNPSGPTIFDQDGHKFADRLHQRVVTRFKAVQRRGNQVFVARCAPHGLRPRDAGFLQVRFGETQPDRPRMPSVAAPTPERRLYRHSAPWCSLCSGNRAAHQRWDS